MAFVELRPPSPVELMVHIPSDEELNSDSEQTSTRSDEVSHILHELETMHKSKSVAQAVFADILRIDSGFSLVNPKKAYFSLHAIVEKDADNLMASSRFAELIRLLPDLHQGEPFDIEGVFKHMRTVVPDDPFAYARLAMCCKKRGYWADAKELFEEALSKDPQDFFSLKQQANLLRKRGKGLEPDLQKAKQYISLARKQQPEDLACIEIEAEIQRLRGKTLDAKHLFERVLSVQRTRFSLSRVGEIFRIGAKDIPKDLKFAYDFFLEAERLKPTNCFTLSRRACVLAVGGTGIDRDIQTAEQLFLTVFKKQPHHSFALGHLGDLRRRQGRLKEAMQLLHQSYEGFSDDPYILTSYVLLLRTPNATAQDRVLAISLMEKARRLAPADPLIHERDRAVSQVGIEEVQGNRERRMTLLQVTLQMEPKNPDHYLALGKEFFNSNPKEVKKLYKTALDLDGNNLYALEHMAEYYAKYEKGIEQAITLLQKARTLSPKNGALRVKLAKLMIRKDRGRQRDYKGAKEVLEEAYSLNCNHRSIHIALGELLRTGGPGITKDADRARKLIEESLSEESADGYASWGYLLLKGEGGLTKDERLAKSYFHQALLIDPEHELASAGLSEPECLDEIHL